MSLEELKAGMVKIKEALTELAEIDPVCPEDAEMCLNLAFKLQAEGKRLGEEFLAILQEQRAAVAFAEELLGGEQE